ncbi:FecR family protein [Filimonas effusa]|uniref:FecR family protein n=1 Tax=Filimonas effusa TaxID=2508721 RepID=A0A4Q1D237_9BACT|nr:FecR family protein [Filimonas effusa]RXK81935.1 FecR family protein [Filimonas effusa]
MKEDNTPEKELALLLKAAALTTGEKLELLSEAERQELQNWLQQQVTHLRWRDNLSEKNTLSDLDKEYASFRSSTLEELKAFHEEHLRQPAAVEPAPRLYFLRKTWFGAAAALLLLAVGAWFFFPSGKTGQAKREEKKTEQIAPGQDGAILTLADGSTLVLDSMGNGKLGHQNGADLLLANGQLEYKNAGTSAGEKTYNTLTTPKGRQFRIRLPDGTIAWLNAASSIRFPTQFTEETRKVDVSGEVYFEAAVAEKKGRKIPFIVNADNRFLVEVLGTHFNINAYPDEPSLNTSLLEGKVAVAAKGGKQKIVLKPGQQASLTMHAGSVKDMVVRNADIEKVMAWKNGFFNFDNARIDEVMRQLERWYDIDVKFESRVPDIEFVGKMTRDISLNGLLIALEKSNVHFRVEGRTLIVMP